MGWCLAEVDFSGSGTTQTLVRSKAGVIVKPELEPLLQFGFDQG